ncbi:MAG TPA: SUF system NifU family Fe-S cluster assembly protein [Trueperaceae bacterium]|nr:SUF system NifU family Fe-S cluster assembly protein [Trueperaceae bacterium]
MSLLDDLYQTVILDHNRRPHNFGVLEPHDVAREGVNPSCGDELTLYLRVAGDVIEKAGFVGEGCAISRASASLMTDALAGLDRTSAAALAGSFLEMIRTGDVGPGLGDLAALRGVSKLHARVKCATLAWLTLEQALTALDGPAQSRD